MISRLFRRRLSTSMSSRIIWRPLLLALILLTVTFALWHVLRTQENKAIEEAVSQELSWAKDTIVNQTALHIEAAGRMAKRWEFSKGLQHEAWEHDALNYVGQIPGLEAIGWLEPSRRVRYMVPGSAKLTAAQPSLFEAAQRTRAPQFSGLTNPGHEGSRALLVFPLFVKDRLSGFLVDVLDMDLVISSILKMSVKEGWGYHLRDGHRELRISDAGAGPEEDRWSQTASLKILGVSAELKAAPRRKVLAQRSSTLSMTILLVGLMLSAALTWGSWSAQGVRRKSAELREAMRLLRQLQQAMDSSAIVSMTDTQGAITYANDNLCRISRYSSEELLGQNHRLLKTELHPEEYYAGLWRTITAGKIWQGEFLNMAKDGSQYWAYATIFPFLDAEGKPESYMGISHDITEQKRLAEDLLRSNRALEDFDHVVAHELKTPLTVIKLAAENLKAAAMGPLNPIQTKVVGMIAGNVDQMGLTINGMLRLAQLRATGGELETRDFDTKSLVRKVLQNLSDLAQKKDILLSEALPEDLPRVKGSPEMFMQILTNLISNAIQKSSREVLVEARALPGCLRFGVRDDGPGMSKERIARLFTKFVSDNRQQTPFFKGSGLGLYICKDLVTHMGGKIWAESAEGAGACFYFTLPTGDPPSPPSAPTA